MVLSCPVCKKESRWEGNPYRPFCSERCKLIDLGTWSEEGYRIAGGEADDEHPGKNGAEDEGQR